MSIIKTVIKIYQKKESRGYKKLYWAIDLHNTILKFNYKKDMAMDFYPYALGVLKLLSEDKESVLILYTATIHYQIKALLDTLEEKGIVFKYINENPEVGNSELADYSEKFCYNILLDDRAGFRPEYEWKDIYEYLNTILDTMTEEYCGECNSTIDLRRELVLQKCSSCGKKVCPCNYCMGEFGADNVDCSTCKIPEGYSSGEEGGLLNH